MESCLENNDENDLFCANVFLFCIDKSMWTYSLLKYYKTRLFISDLLQIYSDTNKS